MIALYVLAGYFAIGVVIAVPFVLAGVPRVMGSDVPLSPGARAILVPGAVALWPLVLRRWVAGGRQP